MKKFLMIFLVSAILLTLSGCSKTGDCAVCRKQDVRVKQVQIKDKSAYACDDCADEIADLKARAERENSMP